LFVKISPGGSRVVCRVLGWGQRSDRSRLLARSTVT